jgi:hypothetical protein
MGVGEGKGEEREGRGGEKLGEGKGEVACLTTFRSVVPPLSMHSCARRARGRPG